jgi:hypothetical protein
MAGGSKGPPRERQEILTQGFTLELNPGVYPWVEWREAKAGLGRFSAGKGRWDSARFLPRTPDTGWKPMLQCSPACRAICQSHPSGYNLDPEWQRDGVM